MIWSKNETLPRSEIEKIQLERLQETVNRVYEKVLPYRKKMDAAGVKPEDIKTLADLAKLPFTTKEDLRDNYPFGLFAVPKKDLVRVHASSGTTGKPTVVGYTKKDLDTWTECVTRIAVMGGATPDDMAQICFGYGMFTGALGLHYGLENIGATIVPSSTGNSEKQIMFMKDFETTLLVATPSYALRLAEVAKEMGVDIKKELKVRIALVGSELLTEAMREEMHKVWGDDCLVTSNYGMSELMGPGVSGECVYRTGLHVNEDHFLPEIIDPETGEPRERGESGELVVTTLTKEGIPLLRYRTKDLTRLNYEPCECGRTFARMDKVRGRSDDMLKIRGVNVFPSQIESVIAAISGIAPHYELILTRQNYTDYLEVRVELTDASLLENYAALDGLRQTVVAKLQTVLGIKAKVTLAAPSSLKRYEGKAKRIIDRRNENPD